MSSKARSRSLHSKPRSVAGSITSLDQGGGESVRVVVRIRPMNENERGAGDAVCVDVVNPTQMRINYKGSSKQFRYRQAFDAHHNQGQVFLEWGVHVLLDSSLDGYSATVFAYGQTGSGKTYTMAGQEDRLGRPGYKSDETDGIIPRSISYIWQEMAQRQEQYYVKAAFLEIYNEEVRDLLNPGSGVLHCRWNIKSGFFVEELLVVDCTNIDDLIAVLHEGIRNRKTGSHNLNTNSSRSHSILTIYLISDIPGEDGSSLKKYGKISFVDLAGSERLKESHSKGKMVKETGNINKSLFTLGKVISSLSDKRVVNKKHIPYRDSKLTMLLMDSLGGTSKALMIACVSPSDKYADESLSTLNYASRTMNIRNKPVIQMDGNEQIVFNLKREIQLLRLENEYLKEQLFRVNGGMPVNPPSKSMQSRISSSGRSSQGSQKVNGNRRLPPLPARAANAAPAAAPKGPDAQKMFAEFQTEINRLKDENTQLNNAAEVQIRNSQSVQKENAGLHMKLRNLENVFVGVSEESGSSLSNEYAITTLLNENANMKKRIQTIEDEKAQHKAKGNSKGNVAPSSEMNEALTIKQQNTQLQKRVEFLQKREKELLEHMIKHEKK